MVKLCGLLFYSGEHDGAVPMIGTLRHVKQLANEMNFTMTEDEPWYHENKVITWFLSLIYQTLFLTNMI